ncbi:MaoC/PaaZ C-terminal domain-containing protein [Alkalihalobacillus deserti]|uniref:MaoC/PaaZ C-terminal domain-containing protein n=1 Tax=Alkalihalobacillus deserti TaxID=2879466 RepID=UPI001D14C66A|nr:MaoC/PaaZ C-terminal domain-containing protein [Alkalihalobacillus deserti]
MIKDWNELELDQELKIDKDPIGKLQLVKYAGASGDFNMIHTDEETAKKVGLPGIIAHGMISMGVLGNFVNEIVGNQGFVSRLQVKFVGMVPLGQSLTCKARVIRKDEERRQVDLKISTEMEPGKFATLGEASIKYF